MPYQNEAALRLENPNKYIKYRRTEGGTIYGSLKVPKSISIIWGHSKGEPKDAWHPQALRFPITGWTEKQAKDWVDKNIKDYISFEPAINTLKTKFSLEINNMLKKLPIYKIIPLESDYTEIAITDNPAIEEYFLKFNDEAIKLEFNTDKQIIKGPVMIPGRLIYRNDALGERFVTYDSDGIRIAASMFLKNGFKFNSEHTDKLLPIEILESYFTESDNYFNVSEGSWVVSAKVNDIDLWNALKKDNMGFSFQALFKNELIGTETINFNKNEQMDLKERLMNAINSVLFGETAEVKEETTEVAMAEQPIVEPEPVVKEPTKEEPTKEELTEEKVQSMISMATEEIMLAVKAMIEESTKKVDEMNTKLEEFSKQPVSQSVTESVTNSSKLNSGSDYSYLSGINK